MARRKGPTIIPAFILDVHLNEVPGDVEAQVAVGERVGCRALIDARDAALGRLVMVPEQPMGRGRACRFAVIDQRDGALADVLLVGYERDMVCRAAASHLLPSPPLY